MFIQLTDSDDGEQARFAVRQILGYGRHHLSECTMLIVGHGTYPVRETPEEIDRMIRKSMGHMATFISVEDLTDDD